MRIRILMKVTEALQRRMRVVQVVADVTKQHSLSPFIHAYEPRPLCLFNRRRFV